MFFLLSLSLVRKSRALKDCAQKRLSISQFGSVTDFAVQAALEKLGLDPKQVTIIQLGGNPNRLAALSSNDRNGYLSQTQQPR